MSTSALVLSVFPGLDLLGRAFEEVGFCVVRGPDLLWGGDIRSFHPPAGPWGGIIGGPPCQMFSRLRHVNPKCGQKHGNLIPEFERVVLEAAPAWFLMENVEGAPVPVVPGYVVQEQLIRDVWVGGVTNRLRRFCFGSTAPTRFEVETLALHSTQPETAAYANGGGRAVPVAIGGSGKRKRTADAPDRLRRIGYQTTHVLTEHLRKQGLPEDFLADAPFTVVGKIRAIGNGVPLPMGRAVARAVVAALRGER